MKQVNRSSSLVAPASSTAFDVFKSEDSNDRNSINAFDTVRRGHTDFKIYFHPTEHSHKSLIEETGGKKVLLQKFKKLKTCVDMNSSVTDHSLSCEYIVPQFASMTLREDFDAYEESVCSFNNTEVKQVPLRKTIDSLN